MVEHETDSGQSNLVQLVWRRIWRFRLLVLFTAALGLSAGLFYSLTVPNQYQSVGKLYVRPGIRDVITPEAAFTNSRPTSPRASGSREAVLNELQVLSGPQLFDKVVEIVGVDLLLAPYVPDPLSEDASWLTSKFHEFQTWWFAPDENRERASLSDRKKVASMLLSQSVSIAAESGTSVIACSYAARSPETARLVVNAALDAARQVHNDVFETMSSLEEIEKTMANAESDALAAEADLRAFCLKHGIHSFETEYSTLLAYLKELEKQLDAANLEIERKDAELKVVDKIERERLKDGANQSAPSVATNPNITAMNGLLTQLRLKQLELEGLKVNLSVAEYNRRKNDLSTLVTETKQRLEEESQQVQVEVARSENPLYLRVAENLDDLKVQLKSLQVMKDKTDKLIQDNSKALDALDALEPKLRSLELDAKNKRAIADGLSENVTRMKAVQRLERLNSSSVQIMHYGTFEPSKIAPRRARTVFLGLCVGLFFGVGLSFLFGLRDTKVRYPSDFTSLGLPEAAVLQRAWGAGRLSRSAVSLPPALSRLSDDVPRFWASVPYDRGADEGVKIGFVGCGGGADAGRAAATFAIGFAAHAGERVAYVSCVNGRDYLASTLGIDSKVGWTDVVGDQKALAGAMIETEVEGLAYLPMGSKAGAEPNPVTDASFAKMLDELAKNHRFVIVELPNLAAIPETRVVMDIVDAVELVARAGGSQRAQVQEAANAVEGGGARLLGVVLQG